MNTELILRFQDLSLYETTSALPDKEELCSKILEFFSLSYVKRKEASKEIGETVRCLEAIDSQHILIPLAKGEIERMKVVTDGARKYFERLSSYDLSKVSPAISALVLSRQQLFDLILSHFVSREQEKLCLAYRYNNKDPLICALFSSTLLHSEPFNSLKISRKAYADEPNDPVIAMVYAMQLSGFNPLVYPNIRKRNDIFLKVAKSTQQARLYLGVAGVSEMDKDPHIALRMYNRAVHVLRRFCKMEPQHREELWMAVALRALYCLSSRIVCNCELIEKELELLSRAKITNMPTLLYVAKAYTQKKEGFKTDYAQALSLCTRIILNEKCDKETKRAVLDFSAMIYEKGGFGVRQDLDLADQIHAQLEIKDSDSAEIETMKVSRREIIEAQIIDFLSLPYLEKVLRAKEIERSALDLLQNFSNDAFVALESHMALGEVYLLRENIDKAIAHFRSVVGFLDASAVKQKISSHSINSFMISRVAFLFFMQKSQASSKKYFEVAHQLAKDDPFTLCGLSVAWQQEHISRSELLLQRAFDLDPENPFVVFHYALGHLQGQRRLFYDKEKAKSVLEKACLTTPGSICVHFLLAEMLAADDPKQAYVHYTKAIQSPMVFKNPYGFLSLIKRAKLVLETVQFFAERADAYSDLQLVFEQTDDVDLLYECALVYESQKEELQFNKRHLRAFYNKILQKLPSHKPAADALQLLQRF
jgi:tetratricopeptide (TPR) repeat protein